MNAPLDPETAAALFRSGSVMIRMDAPNTPFVYGRWMGEPCICTPLPFDDAVAYFTQHPAMTLEDYVEPPPGTAARAILSMSLGGVTLKGTAMAVSLANGQAVDLTVSFVDAQGDAAAAPGAVTWTSSDDAIATVAAKADDTQATVTSLAEGAATITASSGDVSATLDVTVVAGEAASASIAAGAPYTPAR